MYKDLETQLGVELRWHTGQEARLLTLDIPSIHLPTDTERKRDGYHCHLVVNVVRCRKSLDGGNNEEPFVRELAASSGDAKS